MSRSNRVAAVVADIAEADAGARFVLEDVIAGYGSVTVLRGTTVVVPANAVVALLGPNGAGKTTLLRVASGLVAPSEGRVRFGDDDVTGWSPARRAEHGVCLVPEGRGVFARLTVRENLILQSPLGEESASLDRAVDAFPVLGERMSQVAGTMSGGQQQMLALARAYISNPRVVLLDEVSMGLAPKVVDEIFEFLARLARGGAALLLVEQFVKRALALADYVYLLNRGAVTFAGEPSELDDDALLRAYLGAEVS